MKLCGEARAECTRGRASLWHTSTGPTDTEMTKDLAIPKASPESVARGILDGVQNGDEDIFPDPMSRAMAESWRTGFVKDFERQNAALVA